MADGTVLVRLKRDWFGPGDTLFQARDNPHSFPEEWAGPARQHEGESDADYKVRKEKQRYDTLPSTAEVIEGGKTVAVKFDTANGEQLVVAQAVEGDVKSVGGALNDKGLEEETQTVAKAEAAAKELNVDSGANPRTSGPLPPDAKKLK
jgi:hypothetical protein